MIEVSSIKEVILRVIDSELPDLSVRQMGVLLLLYEGKNRPHAEVISVKQLSEALRLSKPAVTRALDRLAEFSFIQRQSVSTDHRMVNVVITNKGTSYFEKTVLGSVPARHPVCKAEKPRSGRPKKVRGNDASADGEARAFA